MGFGHNEAILPVVNLEIRMRADGFVNTGRVRSGIDAACAYAYFKYWTYWRARALLKNSESILFTSGEMIREEGRATRCCRIG